VKYTIQEVQLFADLGKLLARRHGVKRCSSRQLNAIIEATNLIVMALGRDDVVSVAGSGLQAWLASDDTGMSSKYMARVLLDGPDCAYNYPHDPSDFGRCVRFMEACGVTDISPMAGTGPEWSALVPAWAELLAMYRAECYTGTAPVLYSRMQEVIAARRATRNAREVQP
jgi:hypothetical protein